MTTLDKFIQENPKLPANEIINLFVAYNSSTFNEGTDEKIIEFIKQFKVGDYYSIEYDNVVILFHIKEITKRTIIGDMLVSEYNNESFDYVEDYDLYFVNLIEYKINKIEETHFNEKLNELKSLINSFKNTISEAEKIDFKKDGELLSKLDFMYSNPNMLGEEIDSAYYEYEKEYNDISTLNSHHNIDLLKIGTILYSKKRNTLKKIVSFDETYIEFTHFYIGNTTIYIGNMSDSFNEIIQDNVILPNIDFDSLKTKFNNFKLI
jgi:hypothetical protein